LLWLIHFEMNALELKTNIFQLVEKLDDIDFLQAINVLLEKQFRQSQKKDFWIDLPQNIQLEIETSIKEADERKLIPHNEVMYNIKKKYALI